MIPALHGCNVGTLRAPLPGVLKVIRACAVPFALAAAVLAPGRADACGAVPTPSFTIGAVSPSSGSTGVARDVGIIVSGVPSSPAGGPSQFADVELIDADSGEVVPLTAVAWFSPVATELTMAVHPVEPLAPLHAYRFESRPLDGEGTPGEPYVSRFTTSEALLEPLVLSGELELSLRGAEVDIVASGPCGEPGAVTGKRRALVADVQLPVPSGGQGSYQAVLHFSDHTPSRVNTSDPWNYEISDAEPHEVRVMQSVNILAGQALNLQQEVFEESAPYAGCFTFIVWDAAGHGAQTSACLPSLSPDDVRALALGEEPLDLATDEDVAAEQVQSAAAESRQERPSVVGCSFGASAPSRAPAWLALLLSSLLMRRVSRRARRHA
jgi:hypothetical protein